MLNRLTVLFFTKRFGRNCSFFIFQEYLYFSFSLFQLSGAQAGQFDTFFKQFETLLEG